MESNAVKGLPQLSDLGPFLEPLRGKNAWIVPMTGRSGKLLGNNGDVLMNAVFRRILDWYSINILEGSENADVVLVPPSGALLESYGFPDLLAERLRGTEHLPLVIFPSSALFPTRDPSFLFGARSAESVWMLREQPSINHLRDAWGGSLSRAKVQLVLLHDVVALGHVFVPELIGQPVPTASTLLVAPRADRERSTAISAPLVHKGSTSSLVKELSAALPKSAVGRHLIRWVRKGRTNALADQLAARVGEGIFASLQRKTGRRVRLDISSPQFCSFDEYAQALRNADVVVTDRLHVALPAAILGADVYIAEAGYHKLRGVFEQTLSKIPNVHLAD